METFLLIARLLLAAVFVVAGVSKLLDLGGSRQAVRDFGVPASLAGLLGKALPIFEIGIAIALIPLSSARWGALGALALLLAFVAAIGTNLARGRRLDCHCFGQLHSEPAGWSTLIRNAVLTAVSALVLWQGAGLGAVAWLADLSLSGRTGAVAGLGALALLVVEGWVILQMMGQNGRLLARIDALDAATAPMEELRVGALAPAFALPDLDGVTTSLDELRADGVPVLLVFSDPNCGPCNSLLPELGRWQRDHAAALTIAVVSRGAVEANRAKVDRYGLKRVLLQQDREVAIAYQAGGTPSGLLVRTDGTVGSSLAFGVESLRSLVAQTVGAPASMPAAHASRTTQRAPQTAHGTSAGERSVIGGHG